MGGPPGAAVAAGPRITRREQRAQGPGGDAAGAGLDGELIAFYAPTYGAWVMSVREDTLTGDFIPDEDGATELLWSDIVISEED